ncbi:helicase RepA family protein [Nitrobacter sp. TKz-YC02]|uniref:helicase RepA family protein n=1 Tax=Nitrobacter sp. TKz-YC02 TaxID=3398704 RepID=UPI003CF634D7
MLDLDPPAWLDDIEPPGSLSDYGLPDNVVPFRSDEPAEGMSGERPECTIRPSAFVWRDPATITPRQWIYGHHLIRKYVAATIAPGGVGKSTLTIGDAVAMASGKPLLGLKPHGPLRVWLWNGEDPREEIERRVVAACLHHDIEPSEIAGRLFLDSGRDVPIRIGETGANGPKVAMPVIDALIAAIRDRRIDVLIIDPFVSVHSMPENDNGAMDAAVKAFALVADRTGCAIDLVHHSRKLNGVDADIDAARGGSAIAGAVRSARALNVMSAEAANTLDIPESERRSFVRIDDAKANLAPPSAAKWFKLASEALGNGTADRPEDFVAVAAAWKPPDALDGMTADKLLTVQRALHEQCFRENAQAIDWAGHAIGKVLAIDSYGDAGKKRIKKMIAVWIKSGALKVVPIEDIQRRPRPCIEVGEWAAPV